MSKTIKSQAHLSKTPDDNSGLRNILCKISTSFINATKKFFKGLMIFIMVVSCIVILNKMSVRQKVIKHFEKEQIMRPDLLGMKLHRRHFDTDENPLKIKFKDTGLVKMENCFYRPENKTDSELAYKIITEAENLGWEFNHKRIKEKLHNPNNVLEYHHFSSKERKGLYLYITINKTKLNQLICIKIED